MCCSAAAEAMGKVVASELGGSKVVRMRSSTKLHLEDISTCSTRDPPCSPARPRPPLRRRPGLGPTLPHGIRRGSSCTPPSCGCGEIGGGGGKHRSYPCSPRRREAREGKKKQRRLGWGRTEVACIFRHTPTQFTNC